ncbi:MAG TPA: AMP-binding protein [Ktedonobacterales bacterium]
MSEHDMPTTLPRALAANAASAGDMPALVTDGERITWAELAAAARALAAGLIALGVAPGDRVAVWLPNGSDWLVAHWAATLAGAIVVPLNTRNRPAEVRYILEHAGAAALIMRDNFLRMDYLAGLPEILTGGLPDLRGVIVRQMESRDLPAPAIAWDDAEHRGNGIASDQLAAATAAVAPDDTHMLMYTSGTTGFPKGAMLTHAGLMRSARHHYQSWGFQPGDAILVPGPLSHIIGVVYGCVMPAVGQVVPVTVSVFDAERVLALIQEYRPVVMTGTPTHFQLLAEHPRLADFDVSSLRIGMAGGAASTPDAVRRVTERLGLEALVNGLGMSEAGSVAHTDPSDPPEIHATTVGRPMPWLETRIVDPGTMADQSAGDPGELWIRGTGVMKGYFRDPVATAAALTAEGWLRTGDLLRRGDDGNLRFVGRLKDLFTVGGFNVYPAEVERVLAEHPAVAECQVVGVPDARLGDVPFAIVRFQPGARASAEELIAFCAARLANYKVPRQVHVIESFPLLAAGKRDRMALRDLARRVAAVAAGDA